MAENPIYLGSREKGQNPYYSYQSPRQDGGDTFKIYAQEYAKIPDIWDINSVSLNVWTSAAVGNRVGYLFVVGGSGAEFSLAALKTGNIAASQSGVNLVINKMMYLSTNTVSDIEYWAGYSDLPLIGGGGYILAGLTDNLAGDQISIAIQCKYRNHELGIFRA